MAERACCLASANQKRMYVLNRLSPDGTEYNVPVALRLRGPLSVRRLRQALSALAGRHASLRTSFRIRGHDVVQQIEPRVGVPLLRRDAGSEAEIETIKRTFVQPFDLRRAPLFRAGLIRLDTAEHVLLLDAHHIICDGVSIDILLAELGRLYGGQALETLPAEYTDFAVWQRRFATTPEAKQQEEYWLDLLNGDRPALSLPMDYPRTAAQSFAGDRVFRRPPKELTTALRAVAAKHRVSMYMLLLAAYYVLLSKYAGQEDVIVGTLVAGRRAEQFRGVVGLFVNTLALRSRPAGKLAFTGFLEQVRGECLSAFENQDYQFEDLVDRIGPPRDLGRNPLFDTMFSALSPDGRVARYRGVEFSRHELDYGISKFDLSVTLIEGPDRELVLEFEYCKDLFRRETIERLSSDYLTVLETVVASPCAKLSDISLLTAEERRSLLPVPGQQAGMPHNVVDLFAGQARRNPGAPAVSFGDVTLSYGELDRRADALAGRLYARGVGRGDLVGLLAAPSIEMVVALLGVLKLGAAYLPVDPGTPLGRIQSIVADSGAATLLIQRDAQDPRLSGPTTIVLDEEPGSAGDEPPAGRHAGPDDLAYVIYTSGSTGTPKGVMVPHRALANYVTWAARTYIGDEKVAFALHSSLSVDLTVTSVFAPLVSGNRIVIYQGGDGIGVLRDIVTDNQVELIKLTPTHLTLLADVVKDLGPDGSRLRRIIVGGEDLKTSLAATIHASFGGRIEIFNEYGPTEATVGCTVHKYQPGATAAVSVPIGRPIDHASVFILDPYGNPVPARVTGELYVAGACLARGYLNNPRLTDERFVVRRIGPANLRTYRTGDLARRLPNGDIEYLGRNDDQVKIRGYRIELGEIEASLLKLPHVKEAVVTRRLDAAGDACLCAYLVTGGRFSAQDARARLADRLPAHMIPSWFVPLERLPLGRSGKLDKQALPDPCQRFTSTRPYAPAASGAEVGLARIWEQVLGVRRIGIDDNFFDLGGQSLKATLMAARANRELRAGLSVRDVFTHSTIRDLAALVEPAKEDWPAVEPVREREHYPVSSAQKRLYILNQLAPADVQYNVPFAIEVTGLFDLARWEHAFRSLVARHESLRTSFALIDDEIVQKVEGRIDFAFEDLAPGGAATLQEAVERFVRPFDLTRAPLMRAAVLETGPSTHALIVDMHHIVSDGISIEIILDELGPLYRGETLEPPRLQYKDYATWQRACSTSDRVQAQGAYWRTAFEGELPVLNLPTDFGRGAVQSFDGDLVRFRVEPATVAGVRAIARGCGATMYMALLAAYTILLSKYAGQDDIIVGTPVAGRPHASLQRVVGMFVNTLPMRNQPRGDLPFTEFLRTVKSHALDAYSNQDYQFEELVDALEIERNLSRNPLFDTVFALGTGSRTFRIGGLGVKLLEFDWKISKFDLTLLASEQEDALACELEYCSRLFRRSTIANFAVHYRHLLEQIARHPERCIRDLDPLTDAERRQVQITFNRTGRTHQADRSIHELFEKQVDEAPGHAALVFRDTTLSYGELNRRANQLARRLVGEGVAREDVVGIIAEPSIEMIVGVLGILKAGGAYLPIDGDCPGDRAGAMLDDSGAGIVVTAGAARCPDESRRVIDLNDASLYRGDDSNLGTPVAGGDLAYVIYTSGTTGVPKGVMIEHHAVNNLCAWHVDAFHVTSADRATKYARFSFDASVWEIFPYLQAGAALHIIEERIRLDLPELNRYFERHGISISFLPTQVCELFMELDNRSLRILLTGGDRLRRFTPKPYRVVNNYGPTESAVVATSGTVAAEENRIPIGRPVFNTRIYVLGHGRTLAPIGVPGELCIAGVGLARGYLNDAAKTAAKFVPNPFEPGARMYRTGDLARWRPDGTLEYLGRTDDQVKIRGCRTEPREIEATILAHESVRDAVVVAREDRQSRAFLSAYVVWHGAPQLAELRAYLTSRLPDYMVPAFVLTVEHIPINARGKVDLARLPSPDGSQDTGQGHVDARTETERRLAGIWRQVLDRERVGVHDNFFEMGGDSLRATIMVARANRELAADVPLGAVFDNPCIASLARCFEGDGRHESPVLPPAGRRPYYAITPTQALLHALCASRKGVEYNLPMAFTLCGDLDVARMEGVFQRLIRRHEAFRTSFHKIGSRVVQTVAPTVEFAIERLPECGNREIDEVARDFIRPFDLAAAPLLRVALVPMGPGRHVLLMDMHHLVSDGTSMGIVFQEMAALYAGQEPPSRTATFKDFAEWLPEHLQTKKVRDQERYWEGVLGDPPPPLRLDTDYPRPETFSFAGGRIDFAADPWIHGALKRLCARQGVTLYMVLLAVYNVLLSKYGRQEDVIVGVPTVGRYIADVEDVVGMFVSTHAIRTRPVASLRFDAFLQQVKAAVRGALEHQEYQLWDMMVRHTIRSGGKPLFSTVFVVQDQAFTAMEMPGLNVQEMDPGYHIAKFDLTFGAVERADVLEFELEYSTDVFRRSTARRFARHYLNLLDQIAADPSQELRRLELMTGPEKESLLGLNGSMTDCAAGGTVVQLFERHAQDAPDRVAVAADGRSMTCGELNRRANQVARHLRAEGVAPGDIVAVALPPSAEMIVAVLAVLKAGAAYLPLDPDHPPKRLAHVLADSGATLLLRDLRGGLTGPDGSNLDPVPAASLAYVSYVADRTGVPRGVPIEHRSLLDRCRWYMDRFAVTPDDRSAKVGDFSASASIFEVFPFLCAGASVCIVPEQARRDGERLAAWIEREGVTIAWLPAPQCARLASADNPTLRVLLTSGDHVSGLRQGAYELVRCSGPAENTEVTACCSVHGDGTDTVIGKPIPGSQIYILGHDDGLLPVGVTGELCVAGSGLAREYAGNDGTASSRFTSNPHVPGGRIFRSGCAARWLHDGSVEVTGRMDEVSIDNHRVSLAEIERRLESDPGIKEAAVVFDGDDPLHQRLVAFLVLRGGLPASPESFVRALKLRLGEWLPGYMIPEMYIKVGTIPRGTDGRVQSESLPIPDRRSNAPGESPRTVGAVRSIVADALGMPQVGTEVNLVDLGMDSLKAALIVTRIDGAFGVAPHVCQVLTTPTVLAIAQSLEAGTVPW